MPLISELLPKKQESKLFQKKTYRPWDEDLHTTPDLSTLNDEEPQLTHNNITNTDQTPIVQSVSVIKNSTSSNLDLHDDPDLAKTLRGLFGAQKIIIRCLLNNIEENLEECVITKNICIEEFALECSVPQNTIRAMLQRLKHKKLLHTYENKPGRGGYTRFKIDKNIYLLLSAKM